MESNPNTTNTLVLRIEKTSEVAAEVVEDSNDSVVMVNKKKVKLKRKVEMKVIGKMKLLDQGVDHIVEVVVSVAVEEAALEVEAAVEEASAAALVVVEEAALAEEEEAEADLVAVEAAEEVASAAASVVVEEAALVEAEAAVEVASAAALVVAAAAATMEEEETSMTAMESKDMPLKNLEDLEAVADLEAAEEALAVVDETLMDQSLTTSATVKVKEMVVAGIIISAIITEDSKEIITETMIMMEGTIMEVALCSSIRQNSEVTLIPG